MYFPLLVVTCPAVHSNFDCCLSWIAPDTVISGIYVNLAVQVKHYMDALDSNVGVANSRASLLAFYNTVPAHANFREVDKDDFYEITTRSRKYLKGRKKPDLSGLEKFRSLGMPPSKRARGSNGSGLGALTGS